jgi:hypothetical protein
MKEYFKGEKNEHGKIEMDPAGRLFDPLRLESFGGGRRNIERHCGNLRADRRDFVPDQPLIFMAFIKGTAGFFAGCALVALLFAVA